MLTPGWSQKDWEKSTFGHSHGIGKDPFLLGQEKSNKRKTVFLGKDRKPSCVQTIRGFLSVKVCRATEISLCPGSGAQGLPETEAQPRNSENIMVPHW